jgi:hypothetical protein
MLVDIVLFKNMVDTWDFTESIEATSFTFVVVFQAKLVMTVLITCLHLLLYQSMIVPVFGGPKDILQRHNMFAINENNIIYLLDRVRQLVFSSVLILIQELLKINYLFWHFLSIFLRLFFLLIFYS